MKQQLNSPFGVITSIALAVLLLAIFGCSTAPTNVASAGDANKSSAPATKSAAPGGAQLWAQNCGHCHNIRSPSSFSNAQWEVALLHMRVRANLTAQEHREILAFLKSAH